MTDTLGGGKVPAGSGNMAEEEAGVVVCGVTPALGCNDKTSMLGGGSEDPPGVTVPAGLEGREAWPPAGMAPEPELPVDGGR